MSLLKKRRHTPNRLEIESNEKFERRWKELGYDKMVDAYYHDVPQEREPSSGLGCSSRGCMEMVPSVSQGDKKLMDGIYLGPSVLGFKTPARYQ
jgi:hypothetical protein